MLKSERQLEGELRALLRKTEIINAQEGGQFGKGGKRMKLPEELQRRSSRLEWIRKAKAELEAEAAVGNAREREAQASEAKASGDSHNGRFSAMQPATPSRRPSGISPIQAATSSRDRTAGSKGIKCCQRS